MIRTILAILAALVAGGLVVFGIESGLNPLLFDLPDPPTTMDGDAWAMYMTLLPIGAKIMVVAGWGLGSGVAAYVAAKIDPDRARILSVLIGLMYVGGVVMNAVSFPHPMWMIAIGVLIPYPIARIAAGIAAPEAHEVSAS